MQVVLLTLEFPVDEGQGFGLFWLGVQRWVKIAVQQELVECAEVSCMGACRHSALPGWLSSLGSLGKHSTERQALQDRLQLVKR